MINLYWICSFAILMQERGTTFIIQLPNEPFQTTLFYGTSLELNNNYNQAMQKKQKTIISQRLGPFKSKNYP